MLHNIDIKSCIIFIMQDVFVHCSAALLQWLSGQISWTRVRLRNTISYQADRLNIYLSLCCNMRSLKLFIVLIALISLVSYKPLALFTRGIKMRLGRLGRNQTAETYRCVPCVSKASSWPLVFTFSLLPTSFLPEAKTAPCTIIMSVLSPDKCSS